MAKVENGETLRLITARFLKMNRKRNGIAVIAIFLTALLFTSLFTGAESLLLSKRATDIRQFMNASHAIVQDLTKEQAERVPQALEQNQDITRYGEGIFLGSGMNSEFAFSTEVRYADASMAESYNCLPTTGKLPQKENEIAVSSLILDRLGLPHKIGQTITISWEKNDVTKKIETDEFVVSGFWKGDKAVLSQLLFVSKDYAKKNTSSPTEEEIANGNYNGSYEYAVWYKNLWNLQKKTDNLSETAGLWDAQNKFEVNPAYDWMDEDTFSFQSLFILVLFIMLAGYLIVYNVFSLSVRTDIRAYGLLKNIGMTGKQLKKIVRLQAFFLSAVGIPLGILAGYFAAVCMAPSLNAESAVTAQQVSSPVVVVNANPVLFAVAAVFTLITVYFSCFQACRMVERVSPVEALCLSESDTTQRRKSGRKSRDFSAGWFGMAVKNMHNSWEKGIVVMLSIALSMFVVNCIVMLVTGYDFSSYQKTFLASDFQIDQMTSYALTTNFEGVTEEVREQLDACPYKKTTGYVYYSPEKHKAESRLMDTWNQFAGQFQSNWTAYEKKEWENLQKSGEVNLHFLGISEAVFDKLEWKEKPCEWSDFASGDYVLVDYSRYLDEENNSYYKPGDAFLMRYQSGKEKNYTVLGEAMMPYAIDYPYADMLYVTVMVPEKEFIKYTGIDGAMYGILDAQKGQEKQVQKYLEETVLKENDMLNVFSVLAMKESFQKYVDKYYSIGAFLVLVLFSIAVMNFFNTTATSVLSRKRELTLLEAVGMTRAQIIKMLIAEGCIYFIGAFFIAILLVYFVSEKLLTHTIGQAFFFQMHVTILPCICMMPVLFILAVLIPYYEYKKMSGESIVERIRRE
mgnify:CR=1 FL=1